MKSSTLINLLTEHADALNRIDDPDHFDSDAWLSSRYLTEIGQILPLLQLAQTIKRVLVPVPTSFSYKSDLRQQLAQGTWDEEPAGRRSVRYLVLLGAAAAGLLLLVLRRLKPGRKQNHTEIDNSGSLGLATLSMPEQGILS